MDEKHINRPSKVRKLPVREIKLEGHRERTQVYPVGTDPDIDPAKYELFYKAFAIAGGSVKTAYDAVAGVWNEDNNGPMPTLNQFKCFAYEKDWETRLLTQLSDPTERAAWQQATDSALVALEHVAYKALRDVAEGSAGESKFSSSRVKAAQTILFMSRHARVIEQNAPNASIEGKIAKQIGRGDDDLSTEEIQRRVAEDYERERAHALRQRAGSDPNDETDNPA